MSSGMENIYKGTNFSYYYYYYSRIRTQRIKLDTNEESSVQFTVNV